MPNLSESKDLSFIRRGQSHGIPNEKAHHFSSNKLETNPKESFHMEIPEK